MRFSKTIKLSAWLLVTVVIALTVPSIRAEKFVQAWEQRYASGRGSKVAVDTEGNIIVAGYANMGMGRMDRLIIKYSSNGVGLWTNRWVGSGDSSYTGPGMALGTNGNVYVADFAFGSMGDASDYLTLAFSGDGTLLWSNRYNGTANMADQARAVAVGSSGNVYVTGSSRGSGLSTTVSIISPSHIRVLACLCGRTVTMWQWLGLVRSLITLTTLLTPWPWMQTTMFLSVGFPRRATRIMKTLLWLTQA